MTKDRIIYACVLRSGGDFTPEDVKILRNGIEKFFPGTKKEIHCLTDYPHKQIPARVKTRPLPNNWFGWWSKICLFQPGMFPFNSRIIYFDLDCIITGDMTPLLQYRDSVVAGRPWKRQHGEIHYGMSSWCMSWDAGSLDRIYTGFNEKDILWRDSLPVPSNGDQGWIYKCLGDNWEAVQDIVTGVYSWKRHCKNGVPEDANLVVFHGKPRPREAMTIIIGLV